jgi:4-hydroxyphenylpyruvate dioxygenase-like putative hemolysin
LSFGEGNFGALFRSIERDQQRRGVFDDEFQTRRDGDNASR